jgi:hypothetical protein
MGAAYRSGRAGTLLGISTHWIRRLCEGGLIRAKLSDGGQWRIPASEIERLKREGIPPIPSCIQLDKDEKEEKEVHQNHSPEHGLLAPLSKGVVNFAEDVVIAENRLKKLKIEREAEETQDWFRHRTTSEAETKARERQTELEKRERAEAERALIAWQDTWLEFALASIPRDAPAGARLEVRKSVTETLAQLGPQNSTAVVRPLVVAAVSNALQPWMRQKETVRAIESACGTLPWAVRSFATPTAWQRRAKEAAAAAIGKLPWDSSYDEKLRAGIAAVQSICREVEDSEMREKVLRNVCLWDIDYSQQEDAKAAIRRALQELPLGASEKSLEQAREQALTPFREARKRRERDAQQRQRVESKLFHIRHYLQQMQAADEIEFDDDLDLWKFVNQITPQIRQTLLEELQSQELTGQEIEALIEQLVEEALDD